MQNPLSFIRQAIHIDESTAICSLVYLRLIMLGITLAFLLAWSLAYGAHPHWLVIATVILGIMCWSVFMLRSPALQTIKNAMLREILIDFAWVFVVVFFAGRATNPFIYYYLVLTAHAATLLTTRKAWTMCSLGILIYSGLMLIDLQMHFTHLSSDYRNHLMGMWVNYVGSAVVICFFVTRLIALLRDQHEKMSIIRENHLKNEQLIGLATVSASTVHNLATPLSTLTVLVESMANSNHYDNSVRKDLTLMQQQITRCRNTMDELSLLSDRSDEQKSMKITAIVDNLCGHYALHYPQSAPEILSVVAPHQVILCSPLFQYALINLINNAIESSLQQPDVHFSTRNSELVIVISNTSATNADLILQQWGKPSVSSKQSGLGIGSLLANSTIERQGGTVKIDIAPSPNKSDENNVSVTVLFPLKNELDYE